MKITNYFYAVSIFLTGILSGISVILFKHLLNFSQNLFFLGEITFKYAPNIDYNSKPLGALIIIIPVIGSVFVTYLIKNFASEAKGHGVPEVIFAIKYNKSFIRPIVALIKSIASAISIGTGGSSGMEGPVVQIASTLGSMQNIIFKNLTDLQKATLVACGASSGFAAAFNSPLSGILFSIELLLPIIALETIIPLMISTSIAVFISNYAFGNNPYFVIHHILPQGKISDLYEYILLGSFAGICAAFFIWSLDNIENYVEKLRFNGYLKHGFGMFLLGITLYLMHKYTGNYYVESSGYPTILKIFNGNVNGLSLLISLFFIKMLVTFLTLGSGASGGIFSPSLFM